jgi:3',5'-cyclic AMP phosphodiesterase CpdA
MRLVAISDTHGLHNRIDDLPDGDVLVHAGDIMNSGYDPEDIRSFNRWLGENPFKHRVVCAGNHDRYFQNAPETAYSGRCGQVIPFDVGTGFCLMWAAIPL